MKHRRTLLATTAMAVLGLVVAAQSFHAHIDTAQARPAPVAASATWIDPPVRGSETGTIASTLPKPLTVAANLPAAEPTATASAEPQRRAVAVRRGKGSERARLRVARLHRAAHTRTAAADPAALPRPEPRPAHNRIDPIGDILRGLGFGRDS